MARPELWFTAEDVRGIDQRALDEYGIPSIVLMENAAVALREIALERIATLNLRHAMIVAGPGNNGGDGFALARHLDNAGIPLRVGHTLERDAYLGDARTNLDTIAAMGVSLSFLDSGDRFNAWLAESPGPRLIVDALLGTGLARRAAGPIAEIIERINARAGDFVLAVDLPSGLDADLGPVHGPCVRADATVTFVGRKVGMAAPGAAELLGSVVVDDIGVPRALARSLATRPPG